MRMAVISVVKDKHVKETICKELEERGHQIVCYDVMEMNVRRCIGCTNCWLTSPGRCVIKDDYEELLKVYLRYDQVLFLTDTIYGNVVAQMKHVIDRMLPLATMYLRIEQGQLRHVPRYKKKLKMGLIYTGDLQGNDLTPWFLRVMLNFHGTSLGVSSFDNRKEFLLCI